MLTTEQKHADHAIRFQLHQTIKQLSDNWLNLNMMAAQNSLRALRDQIQTIQLGIDSVIEEQMPS